MYHREKGTTPEKKKGDKSYGFDQYSFDDHSDEMDNIEDIKDISKIDHTNG